MENENIIYVTDSEFEKIVLNNSKPVLVDFYAEWCGPCKAMEPHINQMAEEYKGKVVFAKIDTDNNPSYATNYGIRSMPTFILFQNGEQRDVFIGANPRKISEMIEKLLISY